MNFKSMAVDVFRKSIRGLMSVAVSLLSFFMIVLIGFSFTSSAIVAVLGMLLGGYLNYWLHVKTELLVLKE